MTKFVLRKLVDTTVPGPEVPPQAVRSADYGLAYDRARKVIVYAPCLGYHSAGASWSFDGAAWTKRTEKTVQAGNIVQPWSAVWDASRNEVVVWSWDRNDGPIGIVLAPGAADPTVLVANPKFKSFRGPCEAEVLTGDLPKECNDTDWDDCAALIAHDTKRGVTIAVNTGGLWELTGTTWRHCKGIDLRPLPQEIDGRGGVLSHGCGSVSDEAHARVLFWADDREDEFCVVAWDGKALSRLSTNGLPKSRDGYAVGEHPKHGMIVAVDGELFAMQGAGGDFASVGKPSGDVPDDCDCATLATDPSRDLVVLGPPATHSGEQRMFVYRGGAWTGQGRKISKSVLEPFNNGSRLVEITRVGKDVLAVNRSGGVLRWHAESHRWREALAEPKGGRGAAFDLAARAWGDRLHAIANDGSVWRLDGEDSALAWTSVVAKDKTYNADRSPLGAFDASRGIYVVWGAEKKKGRKNDTFVCDGKTWTKVKAGKVKPEGLDAEDDPFSVFYWPAVKAVVRTSATELALFDGTAWRPEPLAKGELAVSWSQEICVRGDYVVFVQRHASEQRVVRLSRAKSGYTMEELGRFAVPKGRDEDDNAAYDIAWFDEPELRLVAHFEDDDAMTFGMDLTSAFK